MKKVVKETLNERITPPTQGAYAHACKDKILNEIKKFCEEKIQACQEVNDEYAEIDFENLDDEERESMIMNDGAIATCGEILKLINKLYTL